MYEIDGIVYAGEAEKAITVKQVRALSDYKLILKFSTGEKKVFDAKELINTDGVFQKLKDMELFKQAYIDYGTVAWNEELDISPEYLYKYSVLNFEMQIA